MDCHSITLSCRTLSAYLSLFFLILLNVPLQGAITISGSNPVPCGPTDGYYLVDFTISGLEDLQANTDFYEQIEDRRYAIFLYFGDGTHVELIVPGDESSVSCQHIYQVKKDSPAEFELRAEVTSIYLPSDPGTTNVFSQTEILNDTYNREFLGSGTASCSACPTERDAAHLPGRDFYAQVIDPSEGQWVQRIRDAVPGDHFTLAIQYGFDICQIDQGLLEITYPASMFSPKWASSPSANMNTAGKIFYNFEYGPSEDVTDQRLYISFEVLSSAEIEQDYEFTFSRRYQAEEACDGKATLNDVFVELADRIKSGHDPNEKSVDPQFFVEAGPTTLKYQIRFYNEGKDPVHKVRIVDIMDDQLDFNTVRDVLFWTGMAPSPKDVKEIPTEPTDDAIFRWDITPLLPTEGLPPTNGEVAEKKEWAYLSFVVDTKGGLKAESCIPNTAEIFFYFGTASERNFVEQVEACRSCCEREVDANEAFRLGKSDSSIIRLIEAPKSLQRNSEGEFYFTDENFGQTQIQYQECRPSGSNDYICEPVVTVSICNKAQTNTICTDNPPPPPPPPSNVCIICWIIALLLITALLIYLAYRRSPNP